MWLFWCLFEFGVAVLMCCFLCLFAGVWLMFCDAGTL